MLQQAIINNLETNGKVESLIKEIGAITKNQIEIEKLDN